MHLAALPLVLRTASGPPPESTGGDAEVSGALEAERQGRHAHAERLLRQAAACAARRGHDLTSGEAALALGRLLLVRGRPRQAVRAFLEARRHFDRAHLRAEAIRAAVFSGLAATDAGHWRRAEAWLCAAVAAADAVGEGETLWLARVAMARCLFWQGRVDAAVDVLGPVPSDLQDPGTPVPGHGHDASSPGAEPQAIGFVSLAVTHACLAARLALAEGNLPAARQSAARAWDRAVGPHRPTERAAASLAVASVHASAGEVEALRRVVAEGLQASREARAPLRAVRLRLMLADGLRRAGHHADARRVESRLERIDARRLPAVVRLPLERVLGGWRDPGPGARRVPGERSGGVGARHAVVGGGTGLMEGIVEVLTVCQETDDEGLALAKVMGLIRARVAARSVVCLGRDRGEVTRLAADGPEDEREAGWRRAFNEDGEIPSVPLGESPEAALPVPLGGVAIGLIVCGWVSAQPTASLEWSSVRGWLTAVAAGVAPCVRAALDWRAWVATSAVGGMLGTSQAVVALRREVARAALAPFHVVVEGESGSGKELVARALHRLGPRSPRAFCALNCAALSDDLIEAELFGHARGAFTGALADRRGLFEEADQGTLFLDEICDLSARAQAKLLRAVQEGEVRRVGENLAHRVDVRIVVATNQSLRLATAAGTFRQDLLYRLEVIRIIVPPLRDRMEDVPLLARHFWAEATKRLGSRATLAPATLAALARHDWPGNVRELQNVVAGLAVVSGRRGSVGPDRLSAALTIQGEGGPRSTLEEARRMFEAGFVRAALARSGGHRGRAAGALGLTRQGLGKLILRLGLE